MALINIIGMDSEDLRRFTVNGAESLNLSRVLFPERIPWSFSRGGGSNNFLEFTPLHLDGRNENAVLQTSFDAPHLHQNQFVFVCCSPEVTVFRKTNPTELEKALSYWEKFTKAVVDFTLNNRSQCHVLMLEDDADYLNGAAQVIGEKLLVTINIKPNVSSTKLEQHLRSMLSYVFSKDNTLTRTMSELEALSAIRKSRNQKAPDLSTFFTSVSMHLKDLAELHQYKIEIEQQLVSTKEKFKLEIESREKSVTQVRSEHELTLLQIAQLQEEVESMYSQIKQKSKLEEQLAHAHSQIALLEDNLVNEKKATESVRADNRYTQAQLRSDNEFCCLQISQLQEEVESMYSQMKQDSKLEDQLANAHSQIALLEDNLFNEKKATERMWADNLDAQAQLRSENELCLLQIAQLQEELEFNYTKSIQLHNVSSANGSFSAQDLSLQLIANYLSH